MSTPAETVQALKTVNPRYVAFAEAHGHTLAEQIAYDDEKWPGGIACGFILWIAKAKQKAFDGGNGWISHGIGTGGSFVIWDQPAWTDFLQGLATGKQLLDYDKDDPSVEANRLKNQANSRYAPK